MTDHEREQLFQIIDLMDGKFSELIQEMASKGMPVSKHVRWLNTMRQSMPLQTVIETTAVTKTPICIG